MVQNRQGEVKNSIGDGEAKELTCTTHGHEPRGEGCWREERCRVEIKAIKKKNNCNSIINKIYLKKAIPFIIASKE